MEYIEVTVDGRALPLCSLPRGAPVVLDFWTLACQRCPAALCKLEKIAEQRTDGTRFIAVNLDRSDIAKIVLEENAIDRVECGYADRVEARNVMGIRSVPYYCVIGADGTILQHGNVVDIERCLDDLERRRRVQLSVAGGVSAADHMEAAAAAQDSKPLDLDAEF